MSDRAIATVRGFCTSWAGEEPERMLDFFADDAVWIDGDRDVHRGKAALRKELLAQRMAVGPVFMELVTVLSDGRTVLTERIDTNVLDGREFPLKVAGAFEVDDDGLITRWQDYFDEAGFMRQLQDADVPETMEAMANRYAEALRMLGDADGPSSVAADSV